MSEELDSGMRQSGPVSKKFELRAVAGFIPQNRRSGIKRGAKGGAAGRT